MIFLFLSFIIILNEIIIKKNFLSDNIKFSKHKSFVSSHKKSTAGGLFLFLFIFIFEYKIGLLNLFYLFLILLLGMGSDKIKNFSSKIRLLLQVFIAILFIFNTQTLVNDVRIDYFNNLLNKNLFLQITFMTFCFLVLINGTNFIDGVNLNAIGYYILIYLLIFIISKINNLQLDLILNLKIILFLFLIYILNFLNKTQLGDAGAYLLAFYTAFYVIKFINSNPLISPYFAILVLWYPCFENLFSIFRKIYQKKNVSSADNLHLHHNIFLFLKLMNIKNPNNMCGLILNFSNFFLLILGINYFNSTKHLISIIFMNIVIYTFCYNLLIKYNLLKKFKK